MIMKYSILKQIFDTDTNFLHYSIPCLIVNYGCVSYFNKIYNETKTERKCCVRTNSESDFRNQLRFLYIFHSDCHNKKLAASPAFILLKTLSGDICLSFDIQSDYMTHRVV